MSETGRLSGDRGLSIKSFSNMIFLMMFGLIFLGGLDSFSKLKDSSRFLPFVLSAVQY